MHFRNQSGEVSSEQPGPSEVPTNTTATLANVLESAKQAVSVFVSNMVAYSGTGHCEMRILRTLFLPLKTGHLTTIWS